MFFDSEVIAFTKVRLPYGWLGNMSPHPVVYQGEEYATAEALFQCLRFDDEEIRNEISSQASPMAAKMKAKKYRDQMVVEPRGEQDLENMVMVLRLKIDQHPEIRQALLETGNAEIIEDCSKRKQALFWGSALVDGQWVGDNMLGKLWMELREEIRCGVWA